MLCDLVESPHPIDESPTGVQRSSRLCNLEGSGVDARNAVTGQAFNGFARMDIS